MFGFSAVNYGCGCAIYFYADHLVHSTSLCRKHSVLFTKQELPQVMQIIADKTIEGDDVKDTK
jgi:hypothetical protein